MSCIPCRVQFLTCSRGNSALAFGDKAVNPRAATVSGEGRSLIFRTPPLCPTLFFDAHHFDSIALSVPRAMVQELISNQSVCFSPEEREKLDLARNALSRRISKKTMDGAK